MSEVQNYLNAHQIANLIYRLSILTSTSVKNVPKSHDCTETNLESTKLHPIPQKAQVQASISCVQKKRKQGRPPFETSSVLPHSKVRKPGRNHGVDAYLFSTRTACASGSRIATRASLFQRDATSPLLTRRVHRAVSTGLPLLVTFLQDAFRASETVTQQNGCWHSDDRRVGSS